MIRRSLLVFTLGLASVGAAGCAKHAEQATAAAHAPVKELALADAVAAKQAGAVFVDANGADFRKENGIVPGAILLASYKDFDAKTVLPANKDTQLVFYCSNRR